MVNDFYFTIEQGATAEYRDRDSKFIGFSYPVHSKAQFKIRISEVKAAHPKATHCCFGYRIGFDGNEFRSSDDGEPAGTAGKPILGQLYSRELTNTLLIVIRYFGGTLLGVPGLINAYKTTASLVLQVTTIVKKQIEVNYRLQFNYTTMNEVLSICRQYNCSILAQEMQLFCSLELGAPVNRAEALLNRLKAIPDLEVSKIS